VEQTTLWKECGSKRWLNNLICVDISIYWPRRTRTTNKTWVGIAVVRAGVWFQNSQSRTESL